MTRFYIVRHGNTFAPGQIVRRIGARTDLPLTTAGQEQARALGRWFARSGIAFDRVLSGSLARARETASLIVSSQPDTHVVATTRWLDEIDHGVDEGQAEQAVVDRVGSDALRAWDERGVPPPGWLVDRDDRLKAWRTVLAERRHGITLFVTSNGAARFALLAHPHLHAASMKLRTGAFGLITRDADDRLSLRYWDVRPSPGDPVQTPIVAG